MAKIRVYQLAEKWQVDKALLLAELNERGHTVKSLLSSVEESSLNFKAEDLPSGKTESPPSKKAVPLKYSQFEGTKEGPPVPKMREAVPEYPMESASFQSSTPDQFFSKPSSSGSLLPGISLVVAVIASLIAIVAFFQLGNLQGKQRESLRDREASAAKMEEISRDLSKKLDEQETLLKDTIEKSSLRTEQERALRQLRAQAEIIKEIASKAPGVGYHRLREIQQGVDVLLLEAEGPRKP